MSAPTSGQIPRATEAEPASSQRPVGHPAIWWIGNPADFAASSYILLRLTCPTPAKAPKKIAMRIRPARTIKPVAALISSSPFYRAPVSRGTQNNVVPPNSRAREVGSFRERTDRGTSDPLRRGSHQRVHTPREALDRCDHRRTAAAAGPLRRDRSGDPRDHRWHAVHQAGRAQGGGAGRPGGIARSPNRLGLSADRTGPGASSGSSRLGRVGGGPPPSRSGPPTPLGVSGTCPTGVRLGKWWVCFTLPRETDWTDETQRLGCTARRGISHHRCVCGSQPPLLFSSARP